MADSLKKLHVLHHLKKAAPLFWALFLKKFQKHSTKGTCTLRAAEGCLEVYLN